MSAPNSRNSPDGIWGSGAASALGYLLVGSVLMLLGVNGANLVPPLRGAPDWAWVPVLLLGCLGLVFRRRSVPAMLAVTGTAVVAGLPLGGGLGAATHITGAFAFAAVGKAIEMLITPKKTA